VRKSNAYVDGGKDDHKSVTRKKGAKKGSRRTERGKNDKNALKDPGSQKQSPRQKRESPQARGRCPGKKNAVRGVIRKKKSANESFYKP